MSIKINIKSLLLDKDVLKAAFNVFSNDFDILIMYRLKLFNILESLISMIIPPTDDTFECVQITKADINIPRNMWIHKSKLEHSEWTKELYDKIIDEYQLVSHLINVICKKDKAIFSNSEQKHTDDLINTWILILERLLAYSKDVFKVISDAALVKPLWTLLVKNNNIGLLKTLWKCSNDACTEISILISSNKSYANYSDILEFLSTYKLTEDILLCKFDMILDLTYMLKANWKLKSIMNIEK